MVLRSLSNCACSFNEHRYTIYNIQTQTLVTNNINQPTLPIHQYYQYRLLKNLQSDANEAIEEGAVAALIAISLEGKVQRAKINSDMIPPTVNAVGTALELDCGVGLFDVSKYSWYLEKEFTMGGAAGRGPGLPEPPIMEGKSEHYAQFSVEELDSSELEGKAKMSFAKMQVSCNKICDLICDWGMIGH